MITKKSHLIYIFRITFFGATIVLIHLFFVEPNSVQNLVQNFRTETIKSINGQENVLCIGNSHFFSSVDSSLLSPKTVVISDGSISYCTQLALLKKHLPKMPKLKICIIESDVVPLLINTANNRIQVFEADFDGLLELGLSIFDIDELNILQKIYYSVRNYSYVDRIIEAKRFNLSYPQKPSEFKCYKREINYIEKPGFWTNDRVLSEYYEVSKDKESPKRKASMYNRLEENSYALSEMIQLLNTRNITPIFVKFPSRVEGKREIFIQHENTPDRIIRSQVSNNDLFLYDFINDKDFIDDDFHDPNHLNIYGAKKISEKLNSIVLNIMKQKPSLN